MKNNNCIKHYLTTVGLQQNWLIWSALLDIFKFVLCSMVVYIGGLWTVNLLSVKATESVKGTTAIFISYTLIFWIGIAVVALLIPLTLWKEKPHE